MRRLASRQCQSGLPAEVADDLLDAPGAPCDTNQHLGSGWLEQGVRLAEQQELGSTGHKKELEYREQKRGRTPQFRAVPCGKVRYCSSLKLGVTAMVNYPDCVK